MGSCLLLHLLPAGCSGISSSPPQLFDAGQALLEIRHGLATPLALVGLQVTKHSDTAHLFLLCGQRRFIRPTSLRRPTSPPLLGTLQVWRGALLLGDYILHARHRFLGCTALELGAGPGVSGLLAARFARLVVLTGKSVCRLLHHQPRAAGNKAEC